MSNAADMQEEIRSAALQREKNEKHAAERKAQLRAATQRDAEERRSQACFQNFAMYRKTGAARPVRGAPNGALTRAFVPLPVCPRARPGANCSVWTAVPRGVGSQTRVDGGPRVWTAVSMQRARAARTRGAGRRILCRRANISSERSADGRRCGKCARTGKSRPPSRISRSASGPFSHRTNRAPDHYQDSQLVL